jgi:hypothetical protein
MRNRWDYLRNPRELDGWLKANAVIGSILATGMLAMALAGLIINSSGQHDVATEVVLSKTPLQLRDAGDRYVTIEYLRTAGQRANWLTQ